MKSIRLTIAEPWFSMIKNGIKKEEYREIKPFYISRLWDDTKPNYGGCKDFDYIVLINGYRRNSPRISLVHPKIEIRSGKTEWGAKDNITNYFVITWEFIR